MCVDLSNCSSRPLQMFSSINGLLIPGGATSIYNSGYADASNAFFQMAKEVSEGTASITPITIKMIHEEYRAS